MATPTKSHYDPVMAPVLPPDIVIERREEIGRVRFDPNGKENPLTAAINVIAEWAPNHVDENGARVQFNVFEQTFEFIAHPIERKEAKEEYDPYA